MSSGLEAHSLQEAPIPGPRGDHYLGDWSRDVVIGRGETWGCALGSHCFGESRFKSWLWVTADLGESLQHSVPQFSHLEND